MTGLLAGYTMKDIHLVGIVATNPADYSNYSPLAFGYLAAFLKKNLPCAHISIAKDAKSALKMKPDLVGISSATVNFNIANEHAVKIKKHSNIPVIIGGGHISMLPETMPGSMDIGVLGEGEMTFWELLSLYSEEGSFPSEMLAKIKGISYWHNGAVKKNPERPLIENLESIPHPDRKLIENSQERFHMVASRGCPYHCAFCSSKAFWKKHRSFSAEYVVEEIDQLVQEYGAREIHFFDDIFVADRERLRAIARNVIEKKYPGMIDFSCTIRAELADEELVETLAQMGVTQITFGAESNSPSILKYLKGESASPITNQKVVDLAHNMGIGVGPSFIKGVPDETGEDLMRTYDFIISNIRSRKINYFEIHNLTPFPGTKVWEDAKNNGLVNDRMDWEELRTPWEKQFLNKKIPKASFYFFETLTQKARAMLKINEHLLVCVLDANPESEQGRALKIEIEGSRFFDHVELVDFQSWKKHNPPIEQIPELNKYFQTGLKPLILCYCHPTDRFCQDAAERIVWHAFESGADVVYHCGWRHFTPVSASEHSLRVFTKRGLEHYAYFMSGIEEQSDQMVELAAKGIKAEAYRPDDDPFTPSGKAATLLLQELSRNFKLDDLINERERRLRIIEKRIYEKSEKLPFIESRNRRLRRSKAGRLVSKIENKTIKRMLRFLFYRD